MPFDGTTRHAAEIAIVDRMADILATPQDWHQGDFKSEDGWSLCLIGSIHKATGIRVGSIMSLSGPDYRIYQKICELLHPLSVPGWNDAPERVHADILHLLARVRRHFEESP
jgi:hypothetical protein